MHEYGFAGSHCAVRVARTGLGDELCCKQLDNLVADEVASLDRRGPTHLSSGVCFQ